jgi:hypothetical protein
VSILNPALTTDVLSVDSKNGPKEKT